MAALVLREPTRATVAVLGFATVIAQSILLREAMAALGGSELAWGVVLSAWLTGMAIGSRAGVSIGSPRLVAAAPVLMLILTAAGVILFRAAPVLSNAAAGELLTTFHALWLWPAAVLPAGLLGGLAFPVLAAHIGPQGASIAYALEALGALTGGLAFTFVMAPLGTAATLVGGLGLTWAFTLWPVSRVAAGAVLAATIAAAAPAGRLVAEAGWRWAGHPGALSRWAETRHQRVELSSGDPGAVYTDGRLLATYPDPYLTTPRAHLVMLLHPDPDKVLTIGGFADGSFLAWLRHPVTALHIVEEDPAILRLLPDWYGGAFARGLTDPRVRLVGSDPVRAVGRDGAWDMIVLLDGNPETLRTNRTRSREFFSSCRRALAPGGILVVRVCAGDTYLAGAGGRLIEIEAATLGQVFPRVLALPGEEVLMVAAGLEACTTLEASALAARWHARGVIDPHFSPEMLTVLADASRIPDLNRFVHAARAPANTIRRPSAVLIAAALGEARGSRRFLTLARALDSHSPRLLGIVLAALALATLASPFLGRNVGVAAAGVVGGCSMGWVLLLLVAWQSTLGSVYAEIGALTGVFMGGLAAGAWIARRWARPARQLPLILACGCALSVIISSGSATTAPLPQVPPLLILAGLLTGAAFAGVAQLAAAGRTRRGAGVAFAADELGAAVAALCLGLIVIPWAGTTATALALAVIQAAAVPAVIIAVRRGDDLVIS